MKKKIYFILLFYLFISVRIYSQVQRCSDNGGFENGITNDYVFRTYTSSSPIPSSAYNGINTVTNNTSNFIDFNPGTNVVNAAASLVTGTNTFDPQFVSYGINIPRVFAGNNAIRLNTTSGSTPGVDDGSIGITTMTKAFIPDDDEFEFNFSVLFKYTSNHVNGSLPFFRVRVFGPNGLVDQMYVYADPNLCFLNKFHHALTSKGFKQMTLYSDWVCGRLDTSGIIDQNATVEFTIADCNASSHYGVVYIDNICGDTCTDDFYWETCCKPTYEAVGFLPYYADDENIERSNWIRATNIIDSGARAIYHAGNFVEMNPGFEARNSSDFAAYIESCSDEFEYRNQSQNNSELLIKEGFVIVPNPSSNFIELQSEDIISNIIISATDGKTVYSKKAINDKHLQIDISTLSKGIYIVTVITDDGKLHSEKLVKN